MSLTREDLKAVRSELKAELARYPTKDDLRAELERFATEEEFGVFTEDVISKTRVMFDGLAARIEALDRHVSGRLHNHDARIGSLEVRTRVLSKRANEA